MEVDMLKSTVLITCFSTMEYNVSVVKQFDRHFSVANRLYVTCKRCEYTNHTFHGSV